MQPARFINPGRYFGITARIVLHQSATSTLNKCRPCGLKSDLITRGFTPKFAEQPLVTIFESADPVPHMRDRMDQDSKHSKN